MPSVQKVELTLPLFLVMPNTQTRAFVTGASGFVGAHLVFALLQKTILLQRWYAAKTIFLLFMRFLHYIPGLTHPKSPG